ASGSRTIARRRSTALSCDVRRKQRRVRRTRTVAGRVARRSIQMLFPQTFGGTPLALSPCLAGGLQEMRFTTIVVSIAAAASLATPTAYADSHGRRAPHLAAAHVTPAPHVNASAQHGKPTTTGAG